MSVPLSSIPTSLAMARSPIYVTGKNNALATDSLDSMDLDVKIWSGESTTIPTTNNYELSKPYSVDEVINFNIGKLIDSEFVKDFSNYNTTVIVKSVLGEVLNCRVSGSWTYSDAGTAPTTAPWSTGASFFSTKGWREFGVTAEHTTTPMAVTRKRLIGTATSESLAIYYTDVADVVTFGIVWSDGQTEEIDIEGTTGIFSDSTDARDKVLYLPAGVNNLNAYTGFSAAMQPSSNTDLTNYTLFIKDSGGNKLWEVEYEITCEPKYTPYQVAFVNRYGVADYITLFKHSQETANFTGASYQKAVYQDGFTTTDEGKYQAYNVNSRNGWALNTGWVGEDYADVIEDVLMSESVAMLLGNTWIDVVPQRGSIAYQTGLNDKVINYSLNLSLSHDERS